MSCNSKDIGPKRRLNLNFGSNVINTNIDRLCKQSDGIRQQSLTSSVTMTTIMHIELKDRSGNVTALATVSAEDYKEVAKHKWYLFSTNNNDYALRSSDGLRLHHFLLGVPSDGEVVDHRDHNGLNNSRPNLRKATYRQNAQNRVKKQNCSSNFIGVSWDQNREKWIVQCGGKFLGRFAVEDELEAASTYDRAALRYFGTEAKTNNTLLDDDQGDLPIIEKSSKYPKGVQHVSGKFYCIVSFQNVRTRYGPYDTADLAGAQYQAVIAERIKTRQESILQLNILTDEHGDAIIPLRDIDGDVIAQALVDANMWHSLMQYRWYMDDNGYAISKIHGVTTRMHVWVYLQSHEQIPSKHVIDHKSKKGAFPKLNNKSLNLRAATKSQNSQNILSQPHSSQYKGVYRITAKSLKSIRFAAQIKINKKCKYLGSFASEKEAAMAYNIAAIREYGPDALLNVIDI